MAFIEDEVAQYLENQGVAVLGTDMRYGQLSNDPINQIAVIDAQNSNIPSIDTAGKQWFLNVMIRNESYDIGAALANTIYLTLHDKTDILSFISGGTNNVTHSAATRLPIFHGRDTNRDYFWSCQFRFTGA